MEKNELPMTSDAAHSSTIPNIKILVSCHKPVPLPSNEAFLPVQVGAANANAIVSGMQPDNEGENISNRNFTFCELTAQYWAWKNLDADYYGLCHYRRYFCFDGVNHPANDHLQIEVDALNDFSFRDYRLNDVDLLQQQIAGYDLITPPYWDITKAETLDGIKTTIQDHMVAYGLYTDEDASLLRSIVETRQPQYLDAFDSYMQGSKYLGYSCYIMKKELFQEFCEFEFDVLLEFDKRFDYSNITATHKRICGYFGEVLFSVFVAKKLTEGVISHKEVPLLFFHDTSKGYCADTTEQTKEVTRIFWRYRDHSASALLPCVRSLFNKLDPAKQYEVSLLYGFDFVLDGFLNALDDVPSNVSFKALQWSSFPLTSNLLKISLKDFDMIQPLLLPWAGVEGSRSVLWIDGLVLFKQDPAAMLDELTSQPYYCQKNVLLHLELNKPVTKNFLGDYHLSARTDRIVDCAISVINPDLARQQYDVEQIYDVVRQCRAQYRTIEPLREIGKKKSKKRKTPIAPGYLLENQAFRVYVLNQLQVAELPLSIATFGLDLVDTPMWLNADWATEWQKASNPVLVYYKYAKPPMITTNQRFAEDYWRYARQSSLYEVLLAEVLEPDDVIRGDSSLLPQGSKRREFARRVWHKLRG